MADKDMETKDVDLENLEPMSEEELDDLSGAGFGKEVVPDRQTITDDQKDRI